MENGKKVSEAYSDPLVTLCLHSVVKLPGLVKESPMRKALRHICLVQYGSQQSQIRRLRVHRSESKKPHFVSTSILRMNRGSGKLAGIAGS